MSILGSQQIRHHARFYAALAAAVLVWIAASRLSGLGPALSIAISGDCFFLLYLAMTGWFVRGVEPDDLRRLARVDDEGIVLIVIITAAAIALALGSFALLLHEESSGLWELVVALAAVPLGWFTLHTVMAFHYVHVFYSEPDDGPESGNAGGLEFPGGMTEPAMADFLYYSFVVGMTAQVSDVQTTSTAMRRVTLLHGIAAFFFNTVILALCVNVAVSKG